MHGIGHVTIAFSLSFVDEFRCLWWKRINCLFPSMNAQAQGADNNESKNAQTGYVHTDTVDQSNCTRIFLDWISSQIIKRHRVDSSFVFLGCPLPAYPLSGRCHRYPSALNIDRSIMRNRFARDLLVDRTLNEYNRQQWPSLRLHLTKQIVY